MISIAAIHFKINGLFSAVHVPAGPHTALGQSCLLIISGHHPHQKPLRNLLTRVQQRATKIILNSFVKSEHPKRTSRHTLSTTLLSRKQNDSNISLAENMAFKVSRCDSNILTACIALSIMVQLVEHNPCKVLAHQHWVPNLAHPSVSMLRRWFLASASKKVSS